MLIDWFTVIAQATNFLILVWLMKRYLYQPILTALDAREKRIATELADADAKKAEAATEREEFRQKNEDFDRQRAALFSQAADDAAAERRRVLGEAHKDADALRARLQDMIRSEYRNLHEEIARRTQAEVFAIARKTLADLAGSGLEERMADVFVGRLQGMGSAEQQRLAPLFELASAPVLVHSAFDLPAPAHAAIEDAVRSSLRAQGSIRFEVTPNITSGIELIIEGQKIAWSVGDYVSSLEKDVGELLKAQRNQEGEAASQEPK
jgi:F-type H+-transporting ATPase subunit b